ncbi:SURP and G-patch domain-containing protein 2-like [Ambystoma mexicanum]|uniref:SURP and G-patch domain-containing protein 2-like n=1 Tax=Ambystoma mexicanum TaxID=8296 RepID=UPI0037E725C9
MADRQVSREIFEAIMSEMVGTVRMNRGAGASGPMRSTPRSRPQPYGDHFQDGALRSPLETRRGAFAGPSRRDFETERVSAPFLERRRSRSPHRDEEHYFSRRAAVDDLDFGNQRSREQEFRIAAQRNSSPLRSPDQLFSRNVPPRADPERFPMRGEAGPFPPRGELARFPVRGEGGPFPLRGEGERLHPWGEGGRFPPRGDGGPFPPHGGAFFPPGEGGPFPSRGRGGKFLPRPEGTFPVRGRGSSVRGSSVRGGSVRGAARGRGASSISLQSLTKPGTTLDKKTKALMESTSKIATWAGFHRINANDYRRKNPAQSALDTETAVNTLSVFKQSFPPELRSRCFYLIKLFNHAALKKTNLDKDFLSLLLEKNVIAGPKDIRDYINPLDQNLMSIQHYLLKSAHPLFLACNTFEVNVNTGYYTPANIFSAMKKTIFYCRQALVLFGQTYSLATYLRQSRLLKVLGIEEVAPKPADFPNLEDSYLFGSKYMAQLKIWLKKSGHQLKMNKNVDVPKDKEDKVLQAKLKDSQIEGLEPADPKVLETVDKLLENAIENWKERDSEDKEKPAKEKPDFWFLFDENSQEYKYYRLKLAELQKLKQTTTERMMQTDDKTPEELAAESKSMLYARKAKEVKKKLMKGVVSSKAKKMGKTLTGALKRKQTDQQATNQSVVPMDSEDSSDGDCPEVDAKTRETAQNLARLIVEMGPDSKDFKTDSITSNPEFWFLKEEESEAYKYYQKKLTELREAKKNASGSAEVKEESCDATVYEAGDGNSEESKPVLQDPEDEDEEEEDDPAECEAEESTASESNPSTPTHARKRGRPVKASPLKPPKRGRAGELSKVEEPVTVANEKPSGRPALRKKPAKQTEEEEEEDEGVKVGTASGDEDPSVAGQQSKQDAADVVMKETAKRTRKKKAD